MIQDPFLGVLIASLVAITAVGAVACALLLAWIGMMISEMERRTRR